MTIQEAINRTDALKYNTYSNEDKIAWLSRLDAMVNRLILDTHEGTDNVSFVGYDSQTELDTVLLVPSPYDEIYILWLQAQIDLTNGEYDKYNASITLFNTEYEAYENYINRTCMPKSVGGRFRF